PHVVQILDHGVWQGTPYIAMELLDGEDLAKRIQRVGKMTPVEVVRIVAQVCRALNKAHAAGIVHRDLKPDNIYLVPDDEREIAKVLDFGIAKTSTGIDGSNTKTGAMLGTPYYMSPEQAQGIRAVDARSDLWSLAVIAFQALTGKLPFESEALGDLLVKIIVAPVPVPTQIAPELPPTFDAWWAKASQRDPSARFQAARELADSLAIAFGQSGGVGETGDFRAMAASGLNLGASVLNGDPSSLQLAGGAMGSAAGGTMAGTFAAGAGLSKKRGVTSLVLGGAAIVAVVLGILGVSLAMRGKAAPAASAPASPGAIVMDRAVPPPTEPANVASAPAAVVLPPAPVATEAVMDHSASAHPVTPPIATKARPRQASAPSERV
ncbi:MAG: serine/threonine-protein kinase, partial [Polyangiaceae bacterium]